MRLDDPTLVAEEYADETRLRRRAAAHAAPNDAADPRALAVSAVAAVRPRRVLEVGCGWGELLEWIARDTGAEVAALDLSPRMVELARERGLDARVGDVQELPFGDGEFDCAVAAWMLYHVADLARAVAELARVLRPDGRLVAVTNSAFHLEELRELVRSGPSPSTFTRENGEELLGRHFARVTREDVDGRVEFPTRCEVEDYVRASISMSSFAANLPDVVDEPFLSRRAISIFVAEEPRPCP